jgi:hypothetical protein
MGSHFHERARLDSAAEDGGEQCQGIYWDVKTVAGNRGRETRLTPKDHFSVAVIGFLPAGRARRIRRRQKQVLMETDL